MVMADPEKGGMSEILTVDVGTSSEAKTKTNSADVMLTQTKRMRSSLAVVLFRDFILSPSPDTSEL